MPRPPRPSDIVLQTRDISILSDLFYSRLMTIKHAAALHFGGRLEAAKKRLQKLHAAGMVSQRDRRPQEPAVYFLGRRGYLHLKQQGIIDSRTDAGWPKIWKRQQIGDLMLRHERSVMDVKTAFTSIIQKCPNLQLIEISTPAEGHRFRVIEAIAGPGSDVRFRSLFARPDGYLHVRECRDGDSVDHYFFIEVDLGTESLGRLVQKLRHYNQHYRKGGFAARFGHHRQDFRLFPFRILMIFSAEERCRNFISKLTLSNLPFGGQALFATLDSVMADPFGRIWSGLRDAPTDTRGLTD